MSSCNSLRAWERKKGGVQGSRKYYSVTWCCKHKRWVSFAYDYINLLIGIWYKKWAVFFSQCPVFVYWVDVEDSNDGNAYRMTGSWTWPAKGPDRFTPDVAVESPGDLCPFASMKLQKVAWFYRFTSFAFLASLPVSPFHDKSLPSRSYSKHLRILLKEPKAIESYWIADVWSCHL